jgi:hypothetical protein
MATKEKEKREKKKYQLKSHWVSKAAAAAITSFCNHSLFNTPVFPQREETI